MALQKVVLRPGVDRQASQTAGEGGWWDSNRVRFRGGMPEKIGGWQRLVSTVLEGRVRAIMAWQLLIGDVLAAIGSNVRLYVYKGGTVTDITPVDRIEEIVDGISTVLDSREVTFEFGSAHGAIEGDILTLDTISGTSRTPSGITVGGVSFSGDYSVLTVVSSTILTIQVEAAATATVAGGGGTADVTFFLPTGPESETAGLGYGAGAYGIGGYGEPAAVAATTLAVRFWALDAWGEILLANPSQAGLYFWEASSTGLITDRAELVLNGTASDGPPLRIGSMLVAMPQRQVVLLGCSDLNSAANFDPLLVRWSDIEDFTQYRAASTNSAGSVRLQGGTEILAGFNSQLQTLIWTDTLLYGMRFIGQPYIYRFDVLGRACGIIGPKAFAEVSGAVYWMSENGFFVFRGGAPEQLPCSVWDDVFLNLNREQAIKVVAGANSLFGEVLWFYPSAGSIECDRYVAFNTLERVWYGGALPRTAWLDRGVFPAPMAADPGTGRIYEHEQGVDADGEVMGEWIESGWFDVGDGEQMMFVDRLLPDWRRLAGQVRLTVSFTDYPGRTPRVRGPFPVVAETEQVAVRVRARQVALRIDGDTQLGGNWRFGALRADTQADGRR